MTNKIFCKICSGNLKKEYEDRGFDWKVLILVCEDCESEDRLKKGEIEEWEYLEGITKEEIKEQDIEEMEDL